MNNPQDSSKQKWIALGVIGFLAISGGIFFFSKNRDAQPHGSEGSSVNSLGLGAVPAHGKKSVSDALPLPSAPSFGSDSSKTISAPAVAVAVAPPALDQCVTVTYQHKASTAHPDEESCSHHKNMLKIPELDGKKVAANSVCVRVNGTPVHYLTVKGRPDELIFGSVAGPKSKVTVRYCTGLAQNCAKEDCSVPKDEFMEAIGGSDDKGQSAKLGQWDPSAPANKEADVMAKLDATVKRELETNDDLNGRAPAGALYKDWIGQTETAACGTKQARN